VSQVAVAGVGRYAQAAARALRSAGAVTHAARSEGAAGAKVRSARTAGRVARYTGAAATVAMLAFAAPALADSGPSEGVSGGGALSGNGKVGADGGGCHARGDSKHLGDRVLCQGMHGHDVRVLQQYLTFAGFPTDIDGGFGASTKRSLIEFQRTRNMAPTGVVTFTVQHVLRAIVKAVQVSPPLTGLNARSAPAPGARAQINSDGTASAPASAPAVVQRVIQAANQIINTSYCFGGGHGSFSSSCYDCSGSASFALHGGGLLSSPEDSTGLESYGAAGPGRWITVYANAGHAFLVVAGRAFDTANMGGPNIPAGTGPRWRSNPLGNLGDGGSYVARHPPGL
jgi:peptidoglycan hydrolase-like protein with peptidoglycan-binding domain